jgi:hypothetical protein
VSATAIRDWLVSSEAGRFDDPGFLEALVGKLREAGVPIDRVSASLRTRHPELLGYTARWTAESGCEVVRPARRIIEEPT